MTCDAKQYGDVKQCSHGVSWDVNDPDQPECVTSGECPEACKASARKAYVNHHGSPLKKAIVSMKPPLLTFTIWRDEDHQHNGVELGMYETRLGYVVVDTNPNLSCSDNRVYTHYAASGSRNRQVVAFKGGKVIVRHPTARGWGHWITIKESRV